MTITRHLGLRLFIEGIELPIISATVTASVMQPSRAILLTPPADEAHHILPRSIVHVFYYAGPERVQSSITAPDSAPDEFLDTSDPYRWHLLFCGEVLGYGYQKQTVGRGHQFMCTGFSSYWDAAHLYFGTQSTGDKQFKQAVFMGAVVAESGKKKIDSGDKLVNILRTKPATMPTLQGLLGGCVSLLESAVGVYASTPSVRKFRGVSDFLSQAELRLKLTKQLGINPSDTSSGVLTGSKEFSKAIRGMARNGGGMTTYGDIVRKMLEFTHHLYASQVCPPYIPEGAKAKFLKVVPIKDSKSRGGAVQEQLLDEVGKMRGMINDRLKETTARIVKGGGDETLKDTAAFAVLDGVARYDNQAQDAWTKRHQDNLPNSDLKAITDERIERLQGDGKLKKGDFEHLSRGNELVDQARSTIKNNLMGRRAQDESGGRVNEIIDKGVAEGKMPLYADHTEETLELAASQLQAAEKALKRAFKPQYKTVEGQLQLNDRLLTTLFHPNIWMCPPPRCNVLFPEHYRTFQFRRDFMSEPTRYMLFGMSRAGEQNWSKVYFAPNTDIITGALKADDVAKAANQAVSFLMNHERFTGIIPSINGLGNIAALHTLNKKTEGKEPGTAFTAFGAKDPAVSRAASAEFFEARFAPRSAAVDGPFNPNLVCGLPALVLDPQQESDLQDDKPWLGGTHYLGRINQITHLIGQEGATTSISLSHVRRHNEGLNVFGTYEPTVKVTKEIKIFPKRKPGTHRAEVLGYTVMKKKVNGEMREVRVPIVGAGGVPANSGPDVDAMLEYKEVDFEDAIVRDTPTDQIEREAGREFIQDKADAGPKTNKYRIRPKYLGDSKFGPSAAQFETEAATSNALDLQVKYLPIESERVIDGYKYGPRAPWMSPKAIGSVEVEVFENTQTTVKVKRYNFEFYFEQVARPPWFDSSYLNQAIGDEFYQGLLGCGAVTDPQLVAELPTTTGEDTDFDFSTDEDLLAGDTITRPPTIEEAAALRTQLDTPSRGDALLAELMEGDSPYNTRKLLLETVDGQEFRIPAQIVGGVSTHEAAERLSAAYMRMLRSSTNVPIDVETYLRQFTSRKFATMVDIFGYGWRSGELTFERLTLEAAAGPLGGLSTATAAAAAAASGKGVIGTRFLRPFEEYDPGGSYTAERPDAKEGFHSSAFGDLSNLDLLPHEPLADIDNQEVRKLDVRVDPRAERYERVLDYRHAVRKWAIRG